NRKQCSQHRQIKRPLEQGKYTQNDQHVMGQRDDRGNTKLELEAHTNVNQYHRQSNQKSKTAVFLELLAHLGTDKLGADQFELGAGCRQSSRYLAGQLVITCLGHANQHGSVGTEILHRKLFIPDFSQSGANVKSEEHTSELQSRENLVCRLLL